MGMNWIQERIDCRASAVFARVYKALQDDLAALEQHAPKLPVEEMVTCHVTHEKGTMTVEGESAWQNTSFTLVVCLVEGKDEITITSTPPSGNRTTHRVHADWHPREDRCVLFFDGEESTEWAVSKTLLEPLLFAPPPTGQ